MNTYLLFVIKSAVTDFTRNKIRTLLTSLGILIGVLSVVLIVAFGLGLKKSINEQFESLGSNQLILFPGKVISNGRFTGGGSAVGTIRFDERDIANLKRIRDIKYVIPALSKSIDVSGNGRTESGSLYIAGYEIFDARNLVPKAGSLFTREDSDKRKKVVVLGGVIAEKLFDEPQNAIGKIVKTDKQSFRVVGVLEKKGGGGFGGPDFDSFIYLPYKTGYIFNPDKKFLSVILVADPSVSTDAAKKEISQTLLRRYKADDFSIVELAEIQKAVTDIFGVLNIVLVGIAAISLVVGGIGIMNIMYVTVSERTKEVGVRRALGARQSDILAHFLIEAVILSVFGGLLGLLLAAGIVEGLQRFFPAYISIESVFIALGVSSVIGIVFGVFPARRASQLSPIEAIRYE
jgi:putative ABC transport system permease protein